MASMMIRIKIKIMIMVKIMEVLALDTRTFPDLKSMNFNGRLDKPSSIITE